MADNQPPTLPAGWYLIDDVCQWLGEDRDNLLRNMRNSTVRCAKKFGSHVFVHLPSLVDGAVWCASQADHPETETGGKTDGKKETRQRRGKRLPTRKRKVDRENQPATED